MSAVICLWLFSMIRHDSSYIVEQKIESYNTKSFKAKTPSLERMNYRVKQLKLPDITIQQ